MAAMCNSVLISEDPDILGRVILRCDLPEHDLALRSHYDTKHDCKWYKGHEPAAVPYTPTGPNKKLVTANG